MKYYSIKSEENNQLVLKESSSINFLRYLPAIIGFPLLVYMTYRIYGKISRDEVMGTFEFMLGGVAFLFSLVGFQFLFNKDKNFLPVEMVFDNVEGLFKISVKRRGRLKTAAIPYTEITEFSIRTERAGSSSSTVTNSRSRYYHVVYFLKKDGSIWDLNTFYDNVLKAQEFMEKLRAFVKLKNPSISMPDLNTEELNCFSIEKNNGYTSITWKNNNYKSLIFVSLFALGFVVLLGGAAYLERDFFFGDASWLGIIVLSIFALALSVILIGTFKNAIGTFVIQIEAKTFKWGKWKKNKLKVLREFDLQEIECVFCDFYATTVDQNEVGIYTAKGLAQDTKFDGAAAQLLKENNERLAGEIEKEQQKTLIGRVSGIFNSSGKLIFKITSGDAVDKLRLQMYLKNVLAERKASA